MKILIIDDDYETGKSLENYFKLKAASCTMLMVEEKHWN